MHTLANCRRQLESAGCTFDDVFKVNAFMTDLDDWNRFNAVYMEMHARAAAGADDGRRQAATHLSH